MILRGHRHPLTPPTGQIRHGYPLIPRKVHLRLGEDPPAAGATYPHVIRTADFESELEGNAAMWGWWTRMGMQLPAQDFPGPPVGKPSRSS